MMVTPDEFEAGTFDVASFDHEAHVYVGWSMLTRYSLPETLSRFTRALLGLTQRLGLQGKYHETISWFYLIMIAERRTGDAACDWDEFRRLNPDLLSSNSGLIGQYYSADRLKSEIARRVFVLPDACNGKNLRR